MAGEWIKMRCDLATDPDVVAIAAQLGLDEYAVVGRLCHLWGWASVHTKDGKASVTPEWIDALIRCENFSKSLESVGWLCVTSDGIRLPRFNRHNSKTAKNRALSRDRMRRKRLRERYAGTRTSASPEKRREEKRREETTRQEKEDCSEGVAARPRRSRRCPPDVVLDFDFARREGIPPDALERVAADFRDHEFRDPKSDWPATWRKWVRREVDMRSRSGSGARASPKTAAEQTAANVQEFQRLRAARGGES